MNLRKSIRVKAQHFFYLSFIVYCLSSCKKLDVFEKTVSIPNYQWSSSFNPSFEFSIDDTTHAYRAYIIIRHSDAYRYQNIYISMAVKYPSTDTVLTEKINVQLADNGRGWYGSGMDDIWEYRFPLNKTPLHLRKGSYIFTLQQIMRDNPLPHILNAGIRVEKVQ